MAQPYKRIDDMPLPTIRKHNAEVYDELIREDWGCAQSFGIWMFPIASFTAIVGTLLWFASYSGMFDG